MGRFSNLEGPTATPQPAAPQDSSAVAGPAARDERSCLRDADLAWRRGQSEVALRLYSRALEFDPNLPIAWAGQARMLLELGELNEAKLWSSKGLELFREHPDLLAARALAALRLGEREDAQGFSDAAIGTRQPGAFPWLARAEVLMGLGLGGEDHCLRKAGERAGGDAWMRVLAARACLIHGRDAAALDWAQQAAAAEPRLACAWLTIALANERLGLVDQALAALHQTRSLDRDVPGLNAALTRLNNPGFKGRMRDFLRRIFR